VALLPPMSLASARWTSASESVSSGSASSCS
jgi:hypothetical protein